MELPKKNLLKVIHRIVRSKNRIERVRLTRKSYRQNGFHAFFPLIKNKRALIILKIGWSFFNIIQKCFYVDSSLLMKRELIIEHWDELLSRNCLYEAMNSCNSYHFCMIKPLATATELQVHVTFINAKNR